MFIRQGLLGTFAFISAHVIAWPLSFAFFQYFANVFIIDIIYIIIVGELFIKRIIWVDMNLLGLLNIKFNIFKSSFIVPV